MSQVRIVLVQPSHPGNIGGAARAMKTMGLTELIVVSPRRYPDPQADWRAAGALDVLDAAEIVETVAQAIHDCHWVVGTSTRPRRIPWPVGDAKDLAQQIINRQQENPQVKIAILFGREDNGLSNEELQRCNYHLQIPAAAEYSSLNLAMAVQIVCYEIFQARHLGAGTSGGDATGGPWDKRSATAEEVEAMLTHMQQVLVRSNFLQGDNPGQVMTRIRRLFARVEMDETEVQIFRGVLKHLDNSGS